MTLSYRYDPGFDPPAPVVPIRLIEPGGERAAALLALVDTGADCSLVPSHVAHRLGLPAVSRTALEGIGGRTELATVYAATVELLGLRFLARVVTHGHEAVIGRDLLARFAIRLDGPAAELTIARPRRRPEPSRRGAK